MRVGCRTALTIVALLALASWMPAGQPHLDQGSQPARLADLARDHLRTRLGVLPEQIRVRSIRPLASPCSQALEGCGEGQRVAPSGYVVELVAQEQVYRYHGRVYGGTYVLWREV